MIRSFFIFVSLANVTVQGTTHLVRRTLEPIVRHMVMGKIYMP